MRTKLSKTKAGVSVPALSGPRPGAWKTGEKSTIHAFLNRHWPKTGTCSCCGAKGKTDYAFRLHPLAYTRNIEDYDEMCRRCHMASDGRSEWLATHGFNRG